MLKPPEHQVAGHQAREGQLGPLVDGSGRFYKPLQSDSRGEHEAAFYSSFSSDPRVPSHVRCFFPGFHGTQLLPASDGSGERPHLVLDDIFSSLLRPSVIDLKIGACTWAPNSPDNYLMKCLRKDRETTSLTLGFRISGLRVNTASGFYNPDKNQVKSYTSSDVKRVLKKFVSSNPDSSSDPDCAYVAVVYGGSEGLLAQLLELKAWFEDQTLYHFYSVSVLAGYARDEVGRIRPLVSLVDFAHVVEGDGVIDHNFLGGLCSLIKFISEILIDPDEKFSSGGCLGESKRTPQLGNEN
ncbi:hypothetical protein J5N97_019945 [Dioscorea zingiberensis]|uniref:Inositol polyphosphate multikinase n=1 Tax=Dioscorea zingiberensis TaxID=325984 RepID=A0A9D5HCS3_9LILI|nr:hypothetical protein J5N97_019945 [Dioscorea zingiberensis]